MSGLSQWLWWPLATVFGAPLTLIEAVGFVTGAWCVWLVGRQNPWNWPVGLLQVVAYLLLFWDAGLYADSCLQAVYVALGLIGWWNWVRHRGPAGPLKVRRTSAGEWRVLALAGLAGSVLVAWVLATWSPSTVPVPDAITTVLSLLATWGQVRKRLESWWLWIAADLLYVPLYAVKGLWLTALLYLVFLALCVTGLRRWRASLAEGEGA